ncbi:hypothetical protein M011DRAFT_490115 [Sporormia fimetaria CBS 119925]|uniref:RING-type domain-containing protein n=1 Tax=Sporormia fimetaria CBS 119925 TaxID=1340428 RepID=A0A6A6UZY1_9PLEO|nr:hypothetical protein M011DRAFT_490115 [Sporormia fimetaria CBS 119925]
MSSEQPPNKPDPPASNPSASDPQAIDLPASDPPVSDPPAKDWQPTYKNTYAFFLAQGLQRDAPFNPHLHSCKLCDGKFDYTIHRPVKVLRLACEHMFRSSCLDNYLERRHEFNHGDRCPHCRARWFLSESGVKSMRRAWEARLDNLAEILDPVEEHYMRVALDEVRLREEEKEEDDRMRADLTRAEKEEEERGRAEDEMAEQEEELLWWFEVELAEAEEEERRRVEDEKERLRIEKERAKTLDLLEGRLDESAKGVEEVGSLKEFRKRTKILKIKRKEKRERDRNKEPVPEQEENTDKEPDTIRQLFADLVEPFTSKDSAEIRKMVDRSVSSERLKRKESNPALPKSERRKALPPDELISAWSTSRSEGVSLSRSRSRKQDSTEQAVTQRYNRSMPPEEASARPRYVDQSTQWDSSEEDFFDGGLEEVWRRNQEKQKQLEEEYVALKQQQKRFAERRKTLEERRRLY